MTQSPPPSSQPSPRRVNRDTALPFDLESWSRHVRGRALLPGEAYRRALGADRARASTTGTGYGVYAVTDGEMACREVAPRGHLTIGRHTRCDLLLDSDPAISLRHALVRVWHLDDGLPLFGLLDLDSGAGFELADGSRQRAIVAAGPLVFRIGTTWLVALPRGAGVPDELAPAAIQYSDASAYRVDPHAELRAAPKGPSPNRTTRITVVPRSVSFIDGQLAGASVALGGPRGQPSFEIVLEKDGRGAGIRVSETDVGHGVLLGRDPRCVDAGLRAILNDGISRVHALVIRERDGVMLYDLASTNGMSDGVHRIRSMPLADGGTTVHLRGMGTITMRWRAASSR